MSLDNVLAVAGVAREHITILIFGLVLSVVLMLVAATLIANILNRHRWIAYIGIADNSICSRYDDVGRHSRHTNNICLLEICGVFYTRFIN